MNKENLSLASADDEEVKAEKMETGIPNEETKKPFDQTKFDQAILDIKKDKGFFERVKTGFKSRPIETQIAKTTLGTVASIAGVKSFYDVPEYFRERFKVRGLLGKGKGMAGSVEDLLAANRQKREKASIGEIPTAIEPSQMINMEIEKNTEVRDAINDLNKRLALTREGTVRGSEQRKLLGKLLRENRTQERNSKNERQQEMTKILDEYTTTKVTGIQAARESLNTFFVASGAYGLRGISYGILDGVERYQRLNKEAKNKGESVNFLKDVILDSFKETWNEIRFKDESGKKSIKQKGLSAVKAWGKIARYVGFGAMVHWHPETAGNSIDKALDALQGKVSFSDVAQSYKGNIERLYQFYSKIAAKGTNYLFSFDKEALGETGKTSLAESQLKAPGHIPETVKVPGKETILAPGAKPEVVQPVKPVAPSITEEDWQRGYATEKAMEPSMGKWEKIHELATIKKGEGIEHTLIRQLKNDPKGMGCPQEIMDKGPKAIHLWAGSQAHRIAVDQGFFKVDQDGKTTETWVKWDAKKPAEFILTRDAGSGKYSITDIDSKTYLHEKIPSAPTKQPEGYDTTTQAAIEKIRAGKVAWEADEAKQAEIKKWEESMMKYVEKRQEEMGKAELESLNEKLNLLRSNEAKRLEWVNDFVKNNLGIELKEAMEIPYISKRLDDLGINFYDPDKFKIPALTDQADKFRFFLNHQNLSDDSLKSIFNVYDESDKKLDLERLYQQMEIEQKVISGSDIRREELGGQKEIPLPEAGRPEELIEIKPAKPGGGDEELIEIKVDKKLGEPKPSGRDLDSTDLTEEEKIVLRQQGLKPDEKIPVQRDSSKPRLTSEELKDIRAGIIFEDYEKMLKAPVISSQEVPRLAKSMSENFMELSKSNPDITKHIRDIFAQEHFKTKLTAKELDEFSKNVKELLNKKNKTGLEELLRETLHKISGRSYIEKPK